MTFFVTLLFLVLTGTLTLSESQDNQCCYLYGSAPTNDSVCAIDGRALGLSFYIINPHIPFTDFTVRWFRSDNVTSMASSSEELTTSEYQYHESISNQVLPHPDNKNCSYSSLYRDFFILVVLNFTSDKNGYYWCQIVVNGTVSQPSQYVRIYAADNSSCTQPVMPFDITGEPQCALFSTDTSYTSPIHHETSGIQNLMVVTSSPTTNNKNPVPTFTSSSIAHSMATISETLTVECSSMEPLLYIIGFLSTMVVVFASLSSLLLVLFYVHKSRRQKQESDGNSKQLKCDTQISTRLEDQVEPEILSNKKASEIRIEDAVEDNNYQALNLDEMNYESLYTKISPLKN